MTEKIMNQEQKRLEAQRQRKEVSRCNEDGMVGCKVVMFWVITLPLTVILSGLLFRIRSR